MTFEDLKAGDGVVISKGYCHVRETVTRTTRTQIIVGGTRYRRSNGYLVGCPYARRLYLLLESPETLALVVADKAKLDAWAIASLFGRTSTGNFVAALPHLQAAWAALHDEAKP